MLFGPGDVGGTIIGPEGGKTDITGVLGVLVALTAAEFLTRNGLVSEFEGSDFGRFKTGAGSSKGDDISGSKEFMSVNVKRGALCGDEKGVGLWV